MTGLTSASVCQALRIFLSHAYPDGGEQVPPPQRRLLDCTPETPLELLLKPPLCQSIPQTGDATVINIRLGSIHYPHLKLRITRIPDDSRIVFSVDTHDGMLHFRPDDPEAVRWAEIQRDNRRLKESIEKDFEENGLLTFNALLRQGLGGG